MTKNPVFRDFGFDRSKYPLYIFETHFWFDNILQNTRLESIIIDDN